VPNVRRLAVVVSHPIQYHVPLYKRLATHHGLQLKVFFTWHDGRESTWDHGFGRAFKWDLPVAEGYDFESVPNVAADPGTHHFTGLRNPTLVQRLLAWQPDVVHVTGWAWLSHLMCLRALHRLGVTTMFRGDSHLLDDNARSGLRWQVKRHVLTQVFSWPSKFLVVGQANRRYYEAFGVKPDRLVYCPHSVEVGRFADPAGAVHDIAAAWRAELGITDDKTVILFAGKFEPKKRPIELMRSMQSVRRDDMVLIMAGDGRLRPQVEAIAAADPRRFRIVHFQNQSRMPALYRLGDVFVLPSAYGETWGLAVNEAMACARPVIVSDKVGCAVDVVDHECGWVFASSELNQLHDILEALPDRATLREMGAAAERRSWMFDVSQTEASMVAYLTDGNL
jgi:glycosyltransferase involved in cell wall biosynthesis